MRRGRLMGTKTSWGSGLLMGVVSSEGGVVSGWLTAWRLLWAWSLDGRGVFVGGVGSGWLTAWRLWGSGLLMGVGSGRLVGVASSEGRVGSDCLTGVAFFLR